MKKPLYYLDEYEKSRIIRLHENATKNQYLNTNIITEGFILPTFMWKALGVAAVAGAGVYFYNQWQQSSGKESFIKLGEFCNTQDLSKAPLMNSETELTKIAEDLRDAVEVVDVNVLKFFQGDSPEGTTDEEKIKTSLSKIKSIPDYCKLSKIYKTKYGEDLTNRLDSEVTYGFAETIREPLSKAIEASSGKDGEIKKGVDYGTSTKKDEDNKTSDDSGVIYKNCSGEYGIGCKDLPYTDTIKKIQKCLGIDQTGKFDSKTESELLSTTGEKTIKREDISLLCGDF
jgi:hypothetical protein